MKMIINFFLKLIKILAFARKCIYYEAYLAEKKRSNSLILPAMLVGLFDGPLIFLCALLIESIFLKQSELRNIFPTGVSSPYSLLSALIIISIELLYFRTGKTDQKIVDNFSRLDKHQLSKVKAVAFMYVIFCFVGGDIALYFIL